MFVSTFSPSARSAWSSRFVFLYLDLSDFPFVPCNFAIVERILSWIVLSEIPSLESAGFIGPRLLSVLPPPTLPVLAGLLSFEGSNFLMSTLV